MKLNNFFILMLFVIGNNHAYANSMKLLILNQKFIKRIREAYEQLDESGGSDKVSFEEMFQISSLGRVSVMLKRGCCLSNII